MTDSETSTPVPAPTRKRRAHPEEPLLMPEPAPPVTLVGFSTSASLAKFAPAAVAALGELTNPPKDATAQISAGRSYDFASLPAITDHYRPVLEAHGLALSQMLSGDANVLRVINLLLHESGEWVASDATLALPANLTPQQYGTCVTYLRRYSALAVLGLAGEHDDDAASVSRPAQESAPQRQPAPATGTPAAPSKPAPARTGALPKTKDEMGTGESVTYPNVRLYKVSKEQTKSGKTKWDVKLDGGPWATCWDDKLADLLTAAYAHNHVASVTIVKNDKGFVNVTDVAYLEADTTPDEDDAPMPTQDDIPF